MAKFLSLTACKGLESICCKDFTGSALDEGRRNKVVGRELEVPVVLHKPCELDLRKSDSIEILKVGILKSLGNLDDAIGAEVRDHHCIIILDGANSLALFIYDDKRLEVLIAVATLLELLEGLDGILELVRGLAKNVSFPAPFDHGPVGLVTVHGDLHPSTARSNLSIATLKGSKVLHKRRHVLVTGSIGNIAPVGKDVQAKPLTAVSHGTLHEALELIVPRVHTARAQQSDDVQGVRLESRFNVLPASVLEDRFLLEGDIDQGCALSDYLSGTERVVADLAVTHVLVGRQADGRAVS
mmetsp:Transcript_9615/g.38912  ORF Transcript_9615/g.38912 Transcript_9615/m.38912 type:complete len:298 (+) Transcript_9615:797-1690(+)